MKAKPRTNRTTAHASLSLLGQSRQDYPTYPDRARLEAFPNPRPGRPYRIRCECPEFTSRCPITNQPDFGTIMIDYVPDRLCVESKALKLYLFSYRDQNTFYEAAVNRILDDLVKAIRPIEARVTGRFTPRGGIAITVEAEHRAARRRAPAR